jgi:hypothetical protein
VAIWVDIDCGEIGYLREQWIHRWRETIRYLFGVNPVYECNGSIVSWLFHCKELGEKMLSIWTLEAEEYRTSYQSKAMTFFWVDDKFYKQNRRAILEFAERHNCKVPSKEYGWIEVPNHRVEMLFRLQWAGKCYG